MRLPGQYAVLAQDAFEFLGELSVGVKSGVFVFLDSNAHHLVSLHPDLHFAVYARRSNLHDDDGESDWPPMVLGVRSGVASC